MQSDSLISTAPLTMQMARMGADNLPADPRNAAEVSKSAERFEEVFLRLLMNDMLPAGGDGFFGKESGARIYQDLFVSAVAEQMAKTGALGIKDILQTELSTRLNSRSSTPPSNPLST